MFAEILRLFIGAYFLFSGVNKIFFFDQFSSYLASFFKVPGALAFSIGALVITLEIVFAIIVIVWNGKLLPRILALTLAVPFIIYNLWIFFVLGLQSCNCTYSASGESMTGPLFSITVLFLTVAAVFYFTRHEDRKLKLPIQLATLILLFAAIIGTNAYFRYQFEHDDLIALRQLIAEKPDNNENKDRAEFEIFIQHPKGRPMRTAAFLQRLLSEYGTSVAYVLRSESVKYVDDLMLNLKQNDKITILDQPDSNRFEILGIQIYRNGNLLYRRDQLPEMTAVIYSDVISAMSDKIEGFDACDPVSASKDLIEIINKNSPAETETDLVKVILIMERDCADCDADLLAMLDSYFFDPERFTVNIIYFMGSAPAEGRGTSIAPVELAGLRHWCLYPNKLLLIDFGDGDIGVFPVPGYLGDLDQAINAAFEQRNLQLF